jgi:hypothetical protein
MPKTKYGSESISWSLFCVKYFVGFLYLFEY